MAEQLKLFEKRPQYKTKRDDNAGGTSPVWTLEAVQRKLRQIERKGFIPVPPDIYRIDDGIVGQILEREFGVSENNLSVRDLGTFELKGMRRSSGTLTLGHKKTSKGMTPIEIFNRFGYERPSSRNPEILKKKLFTTVDGRKPNSKGFVLYSSQNSSFKMYHQVSDVAKKEYLATWDISDSIAKWDSVLLVFAETLGKTNARDEKFHYTRAWLMTGLKDIDYLITAGIIKLDLCIDQVVGDKKGPHDRGPHIRIPKSKLQLAYDEVVEIFPY